MGSEASRGADARRRRAYPWRKWYYSRAWRRRRAQQLKAKPWCEPCADMGTATPCTVADHDPPHHGDREAFFHGPLRSSCKTCHDSAKQRQERQGWAAGVDDDGWPSDPAHPFNRQRTA